MNLLGTGSDTMANFDIQTLQQISTHLNLNQVNWIQLVGTYDGRVMSYYTNGTLAVQANVTGPIAVNNEPLAIGENFDDNSDYFNGDIDDVRIYNRALSGDEVSQLYAIESKPPIAITTHPSADRINYGVSASAVALGTKALASQGGLYQSSLIASTANQTATTLGIAAYAGVTINGSVGQTYQIQYSTSLNFDWTAATNITLPYSPYVWVDTSTTVTGQRFYRSVQLQ